MEFRPNRTLGMLTGGVASALALALAAALVVRGLTLPVSGGVVALYAVAALLLALGLAFAYWTYCCATLRYTVDRNGIVIRWGDVRQVVPMGKIERIVPGREAPAPRLRGLSWFGHHAGTGEVDGLGRVICYSTHASPDELLYVVTPEATYALSVHDHVAFGDALQTQQRLGSLIALPQGVQRSALAAQAFWLDRVAQTMAVAAVAGFFLMAFYVFREYPGLPHSLELPFPALSGVIRVGSKDELLGLPLAGAGLLLLNLALGFVLHSWERMVGYLLFGAALVAQGVLLAGAIITIR